MRRVLVDRARARSRKKRMGHLQRVTLGDVRGETLTMGPEEILDLDRAIARLTSLDPRQAEVVELRFFAGLNMSEIAEARNVSKRTASVVKSVPGAMLLQSIPGVGAYRSLVMATEIEPVERFPRPAHLVAYAGLAPRTRRSGLAPIRHGRIPAGANRWLRGAYVRAVVTHCQHAPESWLSRYYDRQKARIGWQTARTASARKLARATHAMLRTGELWREN